MSQVERIRTPEARAKAASNFKANKRKRDFAAREIVVRLIDACADLFTTVPRKLTERPQGRLRGTPLQADARAIMSWLLCHRHGWAYAQAGRALNLDHTSVMLAVARVGERKVLRDQCLVLDTMMNDRNGITWWELPS